MPDAARHARLVAEGRCVDCAQPRDPSPVATRCLPCSQKHRAAQAALRRKKRLEKPWADLTDGDPLPVGGGAPPVYAVAHLRVPLSSAALQGLEQIKKRERARCREAGERYIGFRLSRLVREHIGTFATRDFLVPPRTFNAPVALSFQCDAPTLAIIDYHARRFDGNRAATIRAMLATFAPLPPTPTPVAAWKNREIGEEPSPFEDPNYHREKRQQARRDQARGEAQRQAIVQEAKENRKTHRKNFWEYSPSYQENVARGQRNREAAE